MSDEGKESEFCFKGANKMKIGGVLVKSHRADKELILDWLEEKVGKLFEQWEDVNEELSLSEHLTSDEVYDKLSIVMTCEAQLGLLNELTNLISDEGIHSVQ